MTGSDKNISDFLKGIGLSELIDRFVAEDIDMSVLPMMDREDLRELGLTIGQRKKLMSAMQALSGTSPAPVPATSAPSDAPIQLRRLSVMFCDMVGSTRIGETLNIDEMQSLLQHYYDVAHDIAQEHNGHVVGTQGDGVIILFGYPSALEGFAERCVEAAQALQNALVEKALLFEGQDPIRIATRIGIATGQAAVGQTDETLVGEHLRLVGPVVNRAARLQTVARPQSIAVDLKTQELTRHAVQYSASEQHDLKGLPAGVEVFHLLGVQNVAVKTQQPVTLIGRADEITTLHQLWTRAQTGSPGTLTIVGEAGIGKSTLVQHFVATQTSPRTRVLQVQCTAMTAKSPLSPVSKMLKSMGGDAPAEQIINRILRDASPELMHSAARFLGLSEETGDNASVSLGDRQQVLEQLVQWITNGVGGPTLLVVENAHWADDSTRELLRSVAETADQRGDALFMVATQRDRDNALWENLPEHETIALGSLQRDEASSLIGSVFGNLPVPQAVRENILKHSDGNPLMLETLARAQAQMPRGQVGDTFEVPYTIYESVSKRLDAIQSGRRVVEALAVLNYPAGKELVAAMLDADTNQIAPALDALAQAGLTTQYNGDGRELISIRHQVYRDVIYEQIVGASRGKLHAAAYESLCHFDPSIQSNRPDVLAIHAQAARDWDHTALHALNAGETMLKRSALIEAGHFLEMADAALSRLPDAVAVRQMRLRAITGLASVERSRFGIATDRSATLGQGAVQLARELGDSATELLALNGLYAHALVRADYPQAEKYAHSLLDTAQRSQSKTFEMIGTRAIGAVAFHRGDYDTAIANLSWALDQYDKDEHLPLAHAHGYDHAEICAAFLSMSYWLAGDLDKSRHFSAFSIEHSREIGHAHSLAQAMAFRVLLGGLAREGSELNSIGAEAVELGEKFDIRVMRSAGLFFPYATRLCLQPMPPDADDMIELAARLKEFRAVNPFNYGPLVSSLMADVYLCRNDVEAAEKVLKEGSKTETFTGETWTGPEVLRLRARVAAAKGLHSDAAGLRNQALRQANKAGAFMLSLRIACDVAEAEPSDASLAVVDSALKKITGTGGSWDQERAENLLHAATLA